MDQKHTVARFSKDNLYFEIIVKPDKALDYRRGDSSSIADVLVSETIFSDANKGKKASEENLNKAFGTTDLYEIASTILKSGTLPLNTNQRKKLINDKRKQIIAFITRQCVDPKSNLPHPPLRIEQAFKEIRPSIDPFTSVEAQGKEIIRLLRPILPLKMDQTVLDVSIPAQYSHRAYGLVKGYGTIKNEKWQVDGSWYGLLEIPAGLYGSFLEKMGDATKGTASVKVHH